jgi:lipopolysaccharide transport system permease protein
MNEKFVIIEEQFPSGGPDLGTDHPHEDWANEVHTVSPPQVADLWRDLRAIPFYLPLFKVLVWRAISLRYAQSYFGLVWVVLQPIATTVVVLFMFGIIRANTSDGSNPGLFFFTGIMTWQFFTRGLSETNASLTGHAGILTKIYLPKIMLPFAAIVAAWFDTLIMIALLLLACLLLGNPLSERALLLPVFLSLVSLGALALGIGLAPVNALFREVSVLLPIVLQFGMDATPVLYATSFIPGRWYALYHLNPMTSFVEGVRWSILPQSPPPDPMFLAINILTILLIFGRTKRRRCPSWPAWWRRSFGATRRRRGGRGNHSGRGGGGSCIGAKAARSCAAAACPVLRRCYFM